MNRHFKKDVKRLFSKVNDLSKKIYSENQLKDLPEPVVRYFKFALKNGTKYLSTVRIKHGGTFNLNDKWVNITGEEYFRMDEPGFTWKGKVPLVVAYDKYLNGKGKLVIKLLNIITLDSKEGHEIDQGELLRWLGEAPCYTTALLPSDKIQWEAIDTKSAKIILKHNDLTVSGIFTFSDKGEILRFEAKRFKEDILEDWIGYYHDFREVNGIKVPFEFDAVWFIDSKEKPYAKFVINEINFDTPEFF
ncbi:MAG: hypothetical protein FK734_06685 [Asgard group archaeon]|nr:hypothetical protein [Asgard group archaeon]